MSTTEVRKLREERRVIIDGARAMLDGIEHVSRRKPNAEERATNDRYMSDVDALEARIDQTERRSRLEAAERRIAEVRSLPTVYPASAASISPGRDSEEYRAAYDHFLRSGI